VLTNDCLLFTVNSDSGTEAAELKKYKEVNDLIAAEIEKYQARNAMAEERLRALQSEIRDIEGGTPQA
jgi:hypothetical protein